MNEREWLHITRLKNDYKSIKLLRGAIVTWREVEALNPHQPYSESNPPHKYEVTFNIRAMTLSGERSKHVMLIDLSAIGYPSSPPSLSFITAPVKHPHVYQGGNVCIGGFPIGESLAELCIRMCQFIQYDPSLINSHSIANQTSYQWYVQNQSHLPMDRSPLPTIGIETGKIHRPGLTVKQIRRNDGTGI